MLLQNYSPTGRLTQQQVVKLQKMADQQGLTGTNYGEGGSGYFVGRGRNHYGSKMLLLSSSER